MEEEIKQVNAKRQERLDLLEAIYHTPTSPNYKDDDRYSWAKKIINETFDNQVNEIYAREKSRM